MSGLPELDRTASKLAADTNSKERLAKLHGEARLRAAIDDLANQLCLAVDGNFDFAVRGAVEDETLEKLSMLVNFVLDTGRRGMLALRQHNEALAQLDQAKTVFFSNASHELRTPLTLILGPLEDALSQTPAALSGEALGSAHRNAIRLLKLVNALLDFSRIEAGRLQASFQRTDLAALTMELASVFRSAIERSGLTLTVDCPPLVEPVYVDRQMWEKVVLNLLSNAFKFTFEGGIRVSLRAVEDRVELQVCDTGVGIAATELPRIFERFHRVEGVRARTHEGFGIGLAMIQELARIHGGRVAATSNVGQGSVFTVTLPLGNSHLPAERVEIAPSRQPGLVNSGAYLQEAESWITSDQRGDAIVADAPGAFTDGGRILVADDNSDMRDYIRRLLSQHWSVETVSDGAAALEAARKEPPDLIVSDIMMPNINGHQLVRALRADPATAAIPIVLLSARAGEEAMVEGLDAGADDYMIKPFSGRELVARVRTHVRLSRLRSDTAAIERISALLNSQLDLPDIVQILTDEGTKLCGAQFGAFFYNVLDDAGERYMLYTLSGAPREAFAGFPMPRNTAVFAPTFDGEGIVRMDDVTKDPRYGKSAPYFGMPKGHLQVRSYLAVPVISRSGEVQGGLFFGHTEVARFTERGEHLLKALAHHAAIAIDNAQLYRNERKARAEAETAMRAKDEFLAMLGHELRNPLAPIVTALELMQLRGDRGTERERGVITRQVGHLVRLVDDLLDVSRVTRGKIELRQENLELAQIVTKAIETATPLLEQRRHRLVVDVPPLGLGVRGDIFRLAQVVANLLNNAAKFTEPEGTITLSGSLDGTDVVLRVRDTGIGMEVADLQRIFEMFAQGPQTLARSQGGLGLGLAIARSLIDLHHGSIAAFSEGPRRGSEFVVRLPHRLPQHDELSRSLPDEPGAPAPATLRILVVDDNTDAADMLAQGLEMSGHVVRTAVDGPSALRVAADFRPDVALLDIGLPVMDGYELAQRLRQMPELKGAQLIAVSGYGQATDRERSKASGCDYHLVKPVDLDELEAVLVRTNTRPYDGV